MVRYFAVLDIDLKITLKQLFASGSARIVEYSTRRRCNLLKYETLIYDRHTDSGIVALRQDITFPTLSNAGVQMRNRYCSKDVFGRGGSYTDFNSSEKRITGIAYVVFIFLNSSFREGRLPLSWKEADIVPVPKQRPIQDINKHLRPISLTPILSKIAEDYVVHDFVIPAVLKKIDKRQYGTIPKSCTTHALVSMIHNWHVCSDGNSAVIRVVLFDFRKAFDLIDHNILVRKLLDYDIPNHILCWITDRRQRVKLAQDYFSEWRYIPAGVPQGTKLGPWLFL